MEMLLPFLSKGSTSAVDAMFKTLGLVIAVLVIVFMPSSSITSPCQLAKGALNALNQIKQIAFYSGSGRTPQNIPDQDAVAAKMVGLFLPYDVIMLKQFDGSGCTLFESRPLSALGLPSKTHRQFLVYETE